eukprot:1852572-Pleurochrysis_carterae.AAC.9
MSKVSNNMKGSELCNKHTCDARKEQTDCCTKRGLRSLCDALRAESSSSSRSLAHAAGVPTRTFDKRTQPKHFKDPSQQHGLQTP